MYVANRETSNTRTRTFGMLAAGVAAAGLLVLASAVPSAAQFDPPPPNPDPWWCANLGGQAVSTQAGSTPAGSTVAEGPGTPTAATSAVLGGVSGVVITGTAVGVGVTLKRRRQSAPDGPTAPAERVLVDRGLARTRGLGPTP